MTTATAGYTTLPLTRPAPRLRRGAQRFDAPPERRSGVAFGLAVHLGPAVAFVAALTLGGVTAAHAAAAFAIISLLNLAVVLAAEARSPAVALPAPSRAQWVEGLALVFVKGAGVGGAVVAAGWWLLSLLSPVSGLGGGWLPIFAAVMLTDYAYYWGHRALNHGRGAHPLVRWSRRNHALHHSVPELDFLRGNVSSLFDTAVTGFQIPLAIIATALGLGLTETMVAYALVLMLQGTHHVNHTFDLGWLRHVFMDNHAHKLHHCRRGMLVNHGAMFSLWDRAHGTYFEDWSLNANHLHRSGVTLPVVIER